MVGEVEGAPESAGRNSLVQILGVLLGAFLALHGELVLLGRDRDLLGREARHRQRDPVVVLVGPGNVVGRVIILALRQGRVGQEIEQVVEADR